MKKSLLTALLVAAGITSVSATEVLDGNLTGNLGLTSNYEFRGVSLSNNGPAIQGGIDYQHKSGVYIGNWNSSFRGALNMDNDDVDNAAVQSNLYAGWKKDVYKGIVIDLGTISYLYPNASAGGTKITYSTNEVYAGVGYGPVAVKYSQTTSNYFGVNNSSGTQYYQADVKQSLGALASQLKPLSVVAHYGHTSMAGNGNSNLNYNDMNIGLVYSFPQQWDLGVRYYTNSSMSNKFKQYNSWKGTNFYGDAVVATLVKTF
jgi:uncharacterized protein (TIGR02001 family)